jgi:hypothetical protein
MSYLDANDLIYTNDLKGGIHTGGFSVNSIMMKGGISPITSINNGQLGGSNNVSDLFKTDLVVPNWAYSYFPTNIGLKKNDRHNENDDDDDDDDDSEVIDDNLYDKLLDLVKVHDNELKKKFKKTRKSSIIKKNKTKKQKK